MQVWVQRPENQEHQAEVSGHEVSEESKFSLPLLSALSGPWMVRVTPTLGMAVYFPDSNANAIRNASLTHPGTLCNLGFHVPVKLTQKINHRNHHLCTSHCQPHSCVLKKRRKTTRLLSSPPDSPCFWEAACVCVNVCVFAFNKLNNAKSSGLLKIKVFHYLMIIVFQIILILLSSDLVLKGYTGLK